MNISGVQPYCASTTTWMINNQKKTNLPTFGNAATISQKVVRNGIKAGVPIATAALVSIPIVHNAINNRSNSDYVQRDAYSVYLNNIFGINSNKYDIVKKRCREIKEQFGLEVRFSDIPKGDVGAAVTEIYNELQNFRMHNADGKKGIKTVNITNGKETFWNANDRSISIGTNSKGLDINNVRASIRHELVHDYDTKPELGNKFPSAIDTNNLDLYIREMLGAGLSPNEIVYAFGNRKELLSVVSMSDMSKYSDNFKANLKDAGMPENVFEMTTNNAVSKNSYTKDEINELVSLIQKAIAKEGGAGYLKAEDGRYHDLIHLIILNEIINSYSENIYRGPSYNPPKPKVKKVTRPNGDIDVMKGDQRIKTMRTDGSVAEYGENKYGVYDFVVKETFKDGTIRNHYYNGTHCDFAPDGSCKIYDKDNTLLQERTSDMKVIKYGDIPECETYDVNGIQSIELTEKGVRTIVKEKDGLYSVKEYNNGNKIKRRHSWLSNGIVSIDIGKFHCRSHDYSSGRIYEFEEGRKSGIISECTGGQHYAEYQQYERIKGRWIKKPTGEQKVFSKDYSELLEHKTADGITRKYENGKITELLFPDGTNMIMTDKNVKWEIFKYKLKHIADKKAESCR